MDKVLAEVRRFVCVAIVIPTVAALASGCDRAASAKEGAATGQAPSNRPGYVVDSILPPEEALRRFRMGLDSTTALDGPTRRDELVDRFVVAVRAKDRAALAKLAISRAEFGYLIFPESRLYRPPYRQPPDIAWMLIGASSAGSVTKLLGRADRFELGRYRCEATPTRDGRMRLWTSCVVTVRERGTSRDLRLFGTIIERDGRFKFAGYNSDL